MDVIPAQHSQDPDNEALKNSVILRNVFKHISDHELLELSLVNKLWNEEARILMKKRGNVVARLCCDSNNACQQVFQDFELALREMKVVPFSGMTFDLDPEGCTGQTVSALDSTHEAILAKLTMKHLSVLLLGNWWRSKNFPAFLLIKKLLQDCRRVIEQLTLGIQYNRLKFIQQFVPDSVFPALKVLKLQNYIYMDESADMLQTYTRYSKALVARAPNLQELHTPENMNLTADILEGTVAVLMPQGRVSAPFERISENVVEKVRLETVVMEYTTDSNGEFNLDRFNRIAPKLLKASSQTLRSMELDALLAVAVMSYGICFENVINLEMDMSRLEHEQRVLNVVKAFDFKRIFPNLRKVEIKAVSAPEFSPDHLDTIIAQAEAVLGDPMPDRTEYIKELRVRYNWRFLHNGIVPIPTLAQIFPNIEKLEMEAPAVDNKKFEDIWEHWEDLKELEVHETPFVRAENLDSVFCGIHPEEVAELRENAKKIENYLERVNIVPVRPAIHYSKNLRTLKLTYHGLKDEPFADDGTLIFSKVTTLIAFARCRPALAINLTIATNAVPPAMTHLEPHVTVVTDVPHPLG